MSELINKVARQEVVGYYGKVPTQGDFVGKGLPRQFRDSWDTWLQEVIHISQQQLGSHWLQYYLTFPLYRFALSAGLCGEKTWLGVMIPSVDQIGRYYPITLCRSLVQPTNLLNVFVQHQIWYEKAETLILSCLDDAFVLEQFEEQLSAMEREINTAPNPLDESTSIQRLVQKHEHEAWRVGINDSSAINDLAPLFLPQLLQDCYATYSVWLTQGSEQCPASFLLTKGLPPFKGATALLDGQWQQWGWETQYNPLAKNAG
ncbi:type VI secretion system-associated protein TagF [Thiolinea disciformis]|uniref:type VI secretion system-associated protein TagF n=1 Tax=Thiolinea disciformis TaxID=125614 RepID=UPI000371A41B|nr:type VI secretion system-associated protein TagF [Thiolinea disciformis]